MPTKADYTERIALAVAGFNTGRYTAKFEPNSRLTKGNLRIIAELLESTAATKLLPSVLHDRIRGIKQPYLTQWLVAMETYYAALHERSLRRIGEQQASQLISGLLMLQRDEPQMPAMTREQGINFMLLVMAIGWNANLDHLVYFSHGVFSGDMFVWESEVNQFVMSHDDAGVDLACRILIDQAIEIGRFSEVVALIDGETIPALVDGVL